MKKVSNWGSNQDCIVSSETKNSLIIFFLACSNCDSINVWIIVIQVLFQHFVNFIYLKN